jgi:peptidyl-prolyl cis-trans isomerase-like 1
MGEIVIELYWKHAPMTCRNFAELVRRNYYNGTKFHRIIRDFMIQGKFFLILSETIFIH